MKKGFVIVSLVVLLFVSVVSAGMLIPVNENARENAKAPEKSDVIGETDGGEWDLERVDFIHYAKPDGTGNSNKPKGPRGGDNCYDLMGVKWKTLAVDYTINPTNPYGLSDSFVVSTIAESAERWDSETSSELLNVPSVDSSAVYGSQNYENAIVFGSYPEANVIGVTSVWYTRRGKQIVEFDMLLNTDFVWGDATVNSSLMDLENIVVHELGHAVGLGDMYTEACSSVTMFGYSGEGDIDKRSLEAPDIAGLRQMYG